MVSTKMTVQIEVRGCDVFLPEALMRSVTCRCSDSLIPFENSYPK